MAAITFNRQFRTATSEVYALLRDEKPLGHVSLHYGATEVAATLVLFGDVPEALMVKIVEQIDDDLVMSADTPREDLQVTVFRGNEVAFYNDDSSRPIVPDES